jgi:enoyl-CoA hydratase
MAGGRDCAGSAIGSMPSVILPAHPYEDETMRDTDAPFKHIRIDRDGRVLTLTLDRPEQLNAINSELHEELSRIFRYAQRDPGSDVIVLTGAGKAFCAGGDIPWMQQSIDDQSLFRTIVLEAKEIVFSLLDCEKPIVAKVNGAAAGLGATLALFCDVIFMAQEAVIVDPHVRVGLVAGDGGAVIWPQLIGYARAKHFLMTGDPVKADMALHMGLVNFVEPSEELDLTVDAYVQNLVAGATLAIRWTRTAVNIGLKQLAHAIMDASLGYEALSNGTQDHQIAVTAFIERKSPTFLGR